MSDDYDLGYTKEEVNQLKEKTTMYEKTFFIAGVQHHQLRDVLDKLKEGEKLSLVPEPENKYDPNAVKIQFGDTMCGYVPKKFSAEVSGMIEIGTNLICTIEMLNKSAKPWEMCQVTITEVVE